MKKLILLLFLFSLSGWAKVNKPTLETPVLEKAEGEKNNIGSLKSIVSKMLIEVVATTDPPIVSGPSTGCLNTKITLLASGCPTDSWYYWYKNDQTYNFESSYSSAASVSISAILTANTSYYVKCYKDLVFSANSNVLNVTTLAIPTISNAAATVSLAGPGTANSSISFAGTCSGSLSWHQLSWTDYNEYPTVTYETQVGTGNAVTINMNSFSFYSPIGQTFYSKPEPDRGYFAKCTSLDGCVTTQKVEIPTIASGFSNSALNGTFSLGRFYGTANSFYYGDQVVDITPEDIDLGSAFFSKGVANNTYSTPITSDIKFLKRFKNKWEVWEYDGRSGGYVASKTKKFYTKYEYNSKFPPCSAVWVNATTNAEATVTFGTNCQQLDMSLISVSENTCLGENVNLSFAGTGSSFKIDLNWINDKRYNATNNTQNGYARLLSEYNAFTTTTSATSQNISLQGLAVSGEGTVSGSTPYYYVNSSEILVYPVGQTKENAIKKTINVQQANACCAINLNLASTAGDISTGTVTKQANATTGKITGTNVISGEANVSYEAFSIELQPGFKAENGVVFRAQTGGCN